MITLNRPSRNIVSTYAAPGVKVQYNSQFNMIEVLEDKKVLSAVIVPDKYTLNEFIKYTNLIKKLFNE